MSRAPSPLYKKYFSITGIIGALGLLLLFMPAVFAPFIANGRPLLVICNGKITFPFLIHFFAPDSSEFWVEQAFNFIAVMIPVIAVLTVSLKQRGLRRILIAGSAVIIAIPFMCGQKHMDKTDYRALCREKTQFCVFTPIPFGPFEPVGTPYAPPGKTHLLGCDEVGRDVASRMIYGARTSLAVGIVSTLIALVIGTAVGLAAGYFRNWFDLAVMRIVELLMCFPTFLLLLILMSALGDRNFGQSVPVVIAVLGFTGWIGIAFLVRGETFKQCALPYIQCCEVSGISPSRIMFRHLMPNIAPVLLTSGVFGIAGAILAENGLSFLGFGVQPPGASWGDLLRQAFANPIDYWHLTLFPGAAIFIAVISFNFIGEAIGKVISPR